MVVGCAGWAAYFLARIAGGRLRVAWIGTCLLLARLLMARGIQAMAETRDPVQGFREEHALLYRALEDGQPVVMTDGVLLLSIDHYTPAALLQHLYWVMPDRDVGRRYIAQDLSDRLAERVVPLLHLRLKLVSYRDFVAMNPRFLLHTEGEKSWFYDVMMADGMQFTFKAKMGGAWLYQIEPKGAGASVNPN
jgi:hypothetical protein